MGKMGSSLQGNLSETYYLNLSMNFLKYSAETPAHFEGNIMFFSPGDETSISFDVVNFSASRRRIWTPFKV